MNPQLDVAMLRRMHEFGALKAYDVRYFCRSTHTKRTHYRTFDEAKAREAAALLEETEEGVHVYGYFVKFDNAFSKQ